MKGLFDQVDAFVEDNGGWTLWASVAVTFMPGFQLGSWAIGPWLSGNGFGFTATVEFGRWTELASKVVQVGSAASKGSLIGSGIGLSAATAGAVITGAGSSGSGGANGTFEEQLSQSDFEIFSDISLDTGGSSGSSGFSFDGGSIFNGLIEPFEVSFSRPAPPAAVQPSASSSPKQATAAAAQPTSDTGGFFGSLVSTLNPVNLVDQIFVQPVFDAIEEGKEDFGNLRSSGFSSFGATVTAFGAGAGRAFGLGGLTDAVEGRDKLGAELTPLQRGIRGGLGAAQLGTMVFGVTKLATGVGGFFSRIGQNSVKPSLGAHKKALTEVHEEVGKLPKGEPGKFGSPQAGTSRKGYRLDPPHPDAVPGSPEASFHINWWDYTLGKMRWPRLDGLANL